MKRMRRKRMGGERKMAARRERGESMEGWRHGEKDNKRERERTGEMEGWKDGR